MMLNLQQHEMGISNAYKKLRYFSPPIPMYINSSVRTLISVIKTSRSTSPSSSIFQSQQFGRSPTSDPVNYSVPCIGSTSACSLTSPLGKSLGSLVLNVCKYRYQFRNRRSLESGDRVSLFSAFAAPNSGGNHVKKDLGSVCFRENAPPKIVSEMIEVIRSNQSDVEQKLNSMNVGVTVDSICDIFRVLNCQKVSALRFFAWIRCYQPSICHNSHICSFMIANCGWVGDYTRILSLLNEFSSERICLTGEAFSFLCPFASTKASMMESVKKLIQILNEVGGSCRGSGICALVTMLCTLDLFDMARLTIESTGRKLAYYNILIKEKCQKCKFRDAQDIIDEMWQLGCEPNAKTYNYLLSSLCKSGMTAEASNVLCNMKEKCCFPDQLTFEILIYNSCRLGNMDLAFQCFDEMALSLIEPRLSTHAAFIKSYFFSRQYLEAYNYVRDASIKYERSSTYVYCLLASLHQKAGNYLIAREIVIEMIDKGLKPYSSVYTTVLKHLYRIGRRPLAIDLESRFSMLNCKPSVSTV